jgi:hypothetical protein
MDKMCSIRINKYRNKHETMLSVILKFYVALEKNHNIFYGSITCLDMTYMIIVQRIRIN